MTENVTVWLANTVSVLIILGFVHRLVIKPVNDKLDALKRTEESVKNIEKELHPNGGTSLRDAVTRIEIKQTVIKEEVKQVGGKLDDHIDFHMNEGRRQ